MIKAVPVLMYHAVGERAPTYWNSFSNEELYFVDFQSFDEQLVYLYENGFNAVSVEEVYNWMQGEIELPEKSVVITFDDGYWSHFMVAYPRLKRYKLKGTFFVTVEKIGQPGMLSWDEIRMLKKSGMEIGSHGMSHAPLSNLDKTQLKYELETSRVVLSDVLEYPVRVIAVPGGFYDKKARDVAEWVGYNTVCISDVGYVTKDSDPFYMRRFVIRRDTTMDEFRKIVNLDKGFEQRKRIKQGIFKSMKKMLGIGAYEKLKQQYLNLKNRKNTA